MTQTNKWFCKKSCSTKHGKKHKACDTVSFALAVIVLLFVLSYTTWPHHPLLWLLKKQNCSSMSQRNQSDSKLHKLWRKWLVQLGYLLLNELFFVCSVTLINSAKSLLPTGSSGLLVEAEMAGVEAGGSKSTLVDSWVVSLQNGALVGTGTGFRGRKPRDSTPGMTVPRLSGLQSAARGCQPKPHIPAVCKWSRIMAKLQWLVVPVF